MCTEYVQLLVSRQQRSQMASSSSSETHDVVQELMLYQLWKSHLQCLIVCCLPLSSTGHFQAQCVAGKGVKNAPHVSVLEGFASPLCFFSKGHSIFFALFSLPILSCFHPSSQWCLNQSSDYSCSENFKNVQTWIFFPTCSPSGIL